MKLSLLYESFSIYLLEAMPVGGIQGGRAQGSAPTTASSYAVSLMNDLAARSGTTNPGIGQIKHSRGSMPFWNWASYIGKDPNSRDWWTQVQPEILKAVGDEHAKLDYQTFTSYLMRSTILPAVMAQRETAQMPAVQQPVQQQVATQPIQAGGISVPITVPPGAITVPAGTDPQAYLQRMIQVGRLPANARIRG